MERAVVPIGIAIDIPLGFYGRIAPRSGLALKKGIDVLGGVVDSHYRGEIKVILINLTLPEHLYNLQNKKAQALNNIFASKSRYDISAGDRIAQLIIERCHHATWKEVEELSVSSREGGFGSTGI
jgi:dUTP pyrophosphatase